MLRLCRQTASVTQRALLEVLEPPESEAHEGQEGVSAHEARSTFLQFLCHTRPHAIVPSSPDGALRVAAAALSLLLCPTPAHGESEGETEGGGGGGGGHEEEGDHEWTPVQAAQMLGLVSQSSGGDELGESPELAPGHGPLRAMQADLSSGEDATMDGGVGRHATLGAGFRDATASRLFRVGPGVLVVDICRMWLVDRARMRVWLDCIPATPQFASLFSSARPGGSVCVHVPVEVIVRPIEDSGDVVGSLITLHCPVAASEGPQVQGLEREESDSAGNARRAVRAAFAEVARVWAATMGLVDPFQGGSAWAELQEDATVRSWRQAMTSQQSFRSASAVAPGEAEEEEREGERGVAALTAMEKLREVAATWRID